MSKLLPFPAERRRSISSVPCAPTRPPEQLGNLLQRLAVERPSVLHVLEKLVADVLTILEQEHGSG